jgi:DNA-damage-inducible protein D
MELQPSKGLAIFEQQGIRRLWHDNRWWFSVIDVISVLAERHDGRQAWQDLKRRISAEGAAETVAKCHNFKMRAADGKMRNTDCADTETLLRIIQSVPSPKAEPFKQWLAQVGTERIAEADDPEFAIEEWRMQCPMPTPSGIFCRPSVWMAMMRDILVSILPR